MGAVCVRTFWQHYRGGFNAVADPWIPSDPPQPAAEEAEAWARAVEEEMRSLPPTGAAAANPVYKQQGIWPVHRGALRGDRRHRKPWRLDKDRARRIMRLAEALSNRPSGRRDFVICAPRTGISRVVSRPAHYRGVLSEKTIKVLKTLMTFIDREGRAYPSYQTLADRAHVGLNTAKRACKYLRELNIIQWVQRCVGEVVDGLYRQVQTSNEYVIVDPKEWHCYTPGLEPQTPHGSTWGATPPLPGAETDDTPSEARKRTGLDDALARLRQALGYQIPNQGGG
jgi:hypothetical protein